MLARCDGDRNPRIRRRSEQTFSIKNLGVGADVVEATRNLGPFRDRRPAPVRWRP